MSSITLHTVPKHLAFYRRLYRGGGGFWSATSGIGGKEDWDLRIDNLTGCPDEVVLGIAEISTLSCWKTQEMRKGCLSMKELIRRGNIVESHLRSCETMFSRETDQTPLHPDLPIGEDVNLNGMPGFPSTVETRQLVAKIYQEAAILYLHTILSEPIPGRGDDSVAMEPWLMGLQACQKLSRVSMLSPSLYANCPCRHLIGHWYSQYVWQGV